LQANGGKLHPQVQCLNFPTLPPIFTALEPRILGQRFERVRLASVFLLRTVDPPLESLEGHAVTAIRRIGKRIAIRR